MVMIIRDFGDAHHLTPKEAFSYLHQYKTMDYMEKFYDVEHTLSPKDTVESLGYVSRLHGGQLL